MKYLPILLLILVGCSSPEQSAPEQKSGLVPHDLSVSVTGLVLHETSMTGWERYDTVGLAFEASRDSIEHGDTVVLAAAFIHHAGQLSYKDNDDTVFSARVIYSKDSTGIQDLVISRQVDGVHSRDDYHGLRTLHFVDLRFDTIANSRSVLSGALSKFTLTSVSEHYDAAQQQHTSAWYDLKDFSILPTGVMQLTITKK